ncbi:MAG: hypothetical protein HRT67_13450 [Flavobacteriaceae bacterium]|nr:hypothetical protein [Flavobacteriaceae bacterium]
MNSLSKITGLELSVDDKTGQLIYLQDDEGNEVVNFEIDGNGDAKDTGSYKARLDLMKAIDDKKQSYARINNKSSAPRGDLLINMAPKQIDGFIKGSKNLNSETMVL